ncbi:MAG: hypothetical protein IPP98_00030 [Gemmatimonadetes bacterium]|nr:hypothetical protein [Gemmatimonadota bacterium]MBL0177507.1 hypothetical protein [Gemmatimonadota bacterium]
MFPKLRNLIVVAACAFILAPRIPNASAEETRKWLEVYPFCTGFPSCKFECDPNTPECQTDPDCICTCFR